MAAALLAAAPAIASGAGVATAATAGASIFSWGSLLSLGLTAASAFGQISAGNMQAATLNAQAQQSMLSARMEELKGRQSALTIKKELERTLASQNATFSARGVLQGEGSAEAAAEASRTNAKDDIDLALFGAKMGSESDKFQAAQYKNDASAAKTGGYFKAADTIGSSASVRNAANSLLGGLD